MNPFRDFQKKGVTYADWVYSQVSDVGEGGSIRADVGEKTIVDFRMTLRYVSSTKLGGAKFKTKIAKDGSLWVLRCGTGQSS